MIKFNAIHPRLRQALSAIFVFVCLNVLSVGCNRKVETPLTVEGEWELTNIETRAVKIGSDEVEVYLSFEADRTFEIFQIIGSGRYRRYTGTWTLGGTTLSGKYSDGSSWGSIYAVELADNTLTLTSTASSASTADKKTEVEVYTRTAIPSAVRKDAYDE